uniref:Uncharacterized protein n=1 Tax=Vespula pensylvanica TaxID=30213 RepID=A0A834KS51_VESPE|nr:hypothetical protein H0235_013619 [Vespula pensylvanica]
MTGGPYMKNSNRSSFACSCINDTLALAVKRKPTSVIRALLLLLLALLLVIVVIVIVVEVGVEKQTGQPFVVFRTDCYVSTVTVRMTATFSSREKYAINSENSN